MPTIGDAMDALESRLFVGREAELQRFAGWLADDRADPDILSVTGPGGVGKSALLRAFERVALAHGRTCLRLDGRDFQPTREAFLAALGASALAEAHARLNDSLAVVMVDTFEELGPLLPFLTGEFLPGLDIGVRLVFAGRHSLRQIWGQHTGWGRMVRQMVLSGLSPSNSLTYLDRRGITAARLREQLPRATGGHPLALSLAADLVQQMGVRDLVAAPEWHLVLRSLIETLLSSVTEPLLRELLEASAMVRQFDENTLQALTGRTDIAAAFDRLCQLTMVRAAEHGLMLHDEVRRIIADDLRWRQPERYRDLRFRALAHYRRLTEVAGRAEREWVLAERLFLWEHAWVQSVLFGQDDAGEVWIELGTEADEAKALETEMIWHTQLLPGLGVVNYEQDPSHSHEGHAADMAQLFRLPGRRLMIARDAEGSPIGFSLVVQVCAANVPYLANHRNLGPLLRGYFDRIGWESVPNSPQTSQIFYFIQCTHRGIKAEAVNAALFRELFSVFAGEGVILISLGLDLHKQLFSALGFERLATAHDPQIWGMDEPFEAYVLDLRAIGLEPWIEAIMAGRRPPRVFSPDELERAVQDVLAHWREDAWLADSALAQSAAVARSAPQHHGADAVRLAVEQALARANDEAPPDQALAYRAVAGAYLARTASHERTAEDLAVSRTTFYRLLRRGVHGLAQALASP